MWKLLIFLSFIFLKLVISTNVNEQEIRAEKLLEKVNLINENIANKVRVAAWAYDSNITDANLKTKLQVSLQASKTAKASWEKIIQFDWKKFSNYTLKRQFEKYSILGSAALSEEKHTKLNKIISKMTTRYSTAKICDFENFGKCDLRLDPDLESILKTSRNEKELKHVWVKWRDEVGPYCKNSYKEYIELQKEVAHLNNFTDATTLWLHPYEDANFQNEISQLWQQLKPFYMEIHGYVRHKLRKFYGDEVVSKHGPIPAHLLGDMWAQSWENIADITLPFEGKEKQNVTEEMLKQNYTVHQIFTTAEDFFKSINLSAMTDTFWNKSIFERAKNVEMVCHASAWDFYKDDDFRIKECTAVNEEGLFVTHHEMGHVEYFMQYHKQPVPFRYSANPGFHEAIGDCIALSVKSTKHLQKLGLMQANNSPEIDINNLYRVALDKVAFLPFSYVMEKWRWDVLSGKIGPNDYNCKWWEFREKFQGVEPAVKRSEEDFDPAAKYHIVANVPYIRYFVSFVVQFQFHQVLCEKAGEYQSNNSEKVLHNCDIYQNTDAGNALKKMLSLGTSKPWPDAMEVLTGQRFMDAKPLLEYFKPLRIWLQDYNKKNNVPMGWITSKKVCKKTMDKSSSSRGQPLTIEIVIYSIVITALGYILYN